MSTHIEKRIDRGGKNGYNTCMKQNIKGSFAAKVEDFRLPRYHELPNMGLYLEQVTKYINGYLVPLGCPELTSSMVSNYVKKGVIAPPVKKQYDAEQIAYLMFIGIGKSVLSIENIAQLFAMQKTTYDAPTAYNYFCLELENVLCFICGMKEQLDTIGTSNTHTKVMLRSTIMAASHILFVNNGFEEWRARTQP